jgi:flagellar motility protein MotE (MotC chaperone)
MKKKKVFMTVVIIAILFVKLFIAGELFQELSGVDTSALLVKRAMAETPKSGSPTLPVKDVVEDPLSRERGLMKALELKQQELDNRESRLAAEEQRIQTLKQEIVAKIDILKGLEERLGTVIEVDKTSEGKKYKDLAKVYDSAPPDKVGSMLEKMDTKTAAGITMNMKRDKAGAVLGYLSPQKAIEITREITRVSAKVQSQPQQ